MVSDGKFFPDDNIELRTTEKHFAELDDRRHRMLICLDSKIRYRQASSYLERPRDGQWWTKAGS